MGFGESQPLPFLFLLENRPIRGTVADRKCPYCSIFELQSRSLPSFILVSLLWPLALLVLAPLYFYNSPGHLFFTYLMPLVPFVWVFDGYISCLRTRTPEEIVELLQSVASEKELERWRFRWGEETHTLVLGQLGWFVGTREDG